MSKAHLLPREQWVYDWVDTSVDESLEDFEGDRGTPAEIWDGSSLVPPMVFLAYRSQLLVLFSRSLNFELAHAGTEEVKTKI